VARLDEIPGISLVSAYIILAVGAVSLGRSVDGRRIRQKSSDGPKQEVWDYVPRNIIPLLCPVVLCGQRRLAALVTGGERLGAAAAGHINAVA